MLRRRPAGPAVSGHEVGLQWVILGAILLVVFIGDALILSAVDAGRPAAGAMGWAAPTGDSSSATISAEPPSPSSDAGPAASTVVAVTAVAAKIGVVGSWGIPDGWRFAGLRCARDGGGPVITRVYSPSRWYGPPGAGGTWAVWSGLDLPGRRVVLASAFDANEASFAVEWADGEVTVAHGSALAFRAFTSGSGRINDVPDRIRQLLETAPVVERCQAP